ncbi:MAG: DUF1992 domain-containing protein [Burkholderiales bacterium]|nr:MAG: DUF1992 domain-containing protein [Burkholderiales bacterium]
MSSLDALVEARIAEASQRGDFDDLPGCGRPLALDDDALVPEELRVAHRILRNSGYLPPQLSAACGVGTMLSQAMVEPYDRKQAVVRGRRRLLALSLALESRGGLGRGALEYHAHVAERLAGVDGGEE